MDFRFFIWTLWLLMTLSGRATGENITGPCNLTFYTWEGEVKLVWDSPAQVSLSAHYEVEVARYTKGPWNWTAIPHCKLIQMTQCDLSNVIANANHKSKYSARVRIVSEQNASPWSTKRILFRSVKGNLLPPNFTVSASPTRVSVRIHVKANLIYIFNLGLKYSVYLHKKNASDYEMQQSVVLGGLEDQPGNEVAEVQFDGLSRGQEYCVRSKVEDTAGETTSEVSLEQCLLLPQPEWDTFMWMAFVALSVLGVLALGALFVHCFLRRPAKLPLILRSSGSGWHPLTLGEVPVEIVVNKGWLLRNIKAEEKSIGVKNKMTNEDGEERRNSMDSGVSMDQHLSAREREGAEEGEGQQEDSGFRSLGEAEGSNSRGGSAELPLLGRMNHKCRGAQHKGDIGMAVESPYDGSSLEEVDCGVLPEMTLAVGDGYRSQSPSTGEVIVSDTVEVGEAIHSDTVDSVVIAVGYRPSQLGCVCSGKGSCLWCRVRADCRAEDIEPSVTHILMKEDSVCITDTSDQYPQALTLGFQDNYLHRTVPQTKMIQGQGGGHHLSTTYPPKTLPPS